MFIPGYHGLKKTDEDSVSVSYRAESKADKRTVHLRVLRDRNPHPVDMARLRDEFTRLRSLPARHTTALLDLIEVRGQWILVTEDFPGVPLGEILASRKQNTQEALRLALQIALALEDIHEHGMMHGNLSPRNALFDRETSMLKLTDFGISIFERHEDDFPEYMSPEQTGRMNRAVDYRADFYRAGALFYHLFAGHPPFESKDFVELIHSHIARLPENLARATGDVPETISKIVMKLLSKNAEDRYQSASSLANDLGRCLRELEQTGKVPLFEPGERDTSGTLRLPQKLYGREEAVVELLDAFEESRTTGTGMVFVSGPSGSGKSSLVHELQKSVLRDKGTFIKGKYERHERNVPLTALAEAFGELLRGLLAESEENLEFW